MTGEGWDRGMREGIGGDGRPKGLSFTLVIIDTLRTIALVIGQTRTIRAVDWDLLVIRTQTMTMCVYVREETALKEECMIFIHRVIGFFFNFQM